MLDPKLKDGPLALVVLTGFWPKPKDLGLWLEASIVSPVSAGAAPNWKPGAVATGVAAPNVEAAAGFGVTAPNVGTAAAWKCYSDPIFLRTVNNMTKYSLL